jgi:hypothetical protein
MKLPKMNKKQRKQADFIHLLIQRLGTYLQEMDIKITQSQHGSLLAGMKSNPNKAYKHFLLQIMTEDDFENLIEKPLADFQGLGDTPMKLGQSLAMLITPVADEVAETC